MIDDILAGRRFDPVLDETRINKDYLRSGSLQSKYIFLRLGISYGESCIAIHLLRGFEDCYSMHKDIASGFLNELKEKFGNMFIFPAFWPSKRNGYEHPSSYLYLESGERALCVDVIGGQQYACTENTIYLMSKSTDFGEIPEELAGKRDTLLGQLVKRAIAPYSGCAIVHK